MTIKDMNAREYLIKTAKVKKIDRMLELHRFGMPTFASMGTWGLTGAALADKKRRKKAFKAGLAIGLIKPSMWKLLGKGYAKAVKRPFSELIK